MFIKELTKRDDEIGWSSSGARWAFFAVFIVLIILVVLGTIRVNKKRSQNGEAPIYGTRWMTPPSYRQSQNHYNQNGAQGGSYVPTYTATANEYDMGYYDRNGEFHPNPNSKSAHIAAVPPAHHRNPSDVSNVGPAQNIPNDEVISIEDDDMYRRPQGPPPASTYLPPETPPPHLEPVEGSSSNAESLPSFTEGKNPPVIKEKGGLQ